MREGNFFSSVCLWFCPLTHMVISQTPGPVNLEPLRPIHYVNIYRQVGGWPSTENPSCFRLASYVCESFSALLFSHTWPACRVWQQAWFTLRFRLPQKYHGAYPDFRSQYLAINDSNVHPVRLSSRASSRPVAVSKSTLVWFFCLCKFLKEILTHQGMLGCVQPSRASMVELNTR